MVLMKWYVWIVIEEKKKNYKDRLGTVDANYRRKASTHAKPDFRISY